MSSEKVVTLAVSGKQADQDIVDQLKAALARAEAGDTQALLLVEQSRGEVNYSITGVNDRFQLAGYMSFFIQQLFERDK